MMIMAGRQQNPRIVMVRYGELFLKSDPVKYHFIGILLRNIRRALEAAGHSCTFESPRGRIFVAGKKPEEIAAIISRVFGIVDVSICTRVDSTRKPCGTRRSPWPSPACTLPVGLPCGQSARARPA